MKIRDVLETKAKRALVTVPPGTSLKEAAERLAAEKIGTVVVSADGASALGILSERDIVRTLAQRGTEAFGLTVDDMMTRKVVTCHPDEPVDAALAAMTDGRFRHMPVEQDGAIIGLITLGDAVKARLNEVAYERNAMEEMIMGH